MHILDRKETPQIFLLGICSQHFLHFWFIFKQQNQLFYVELYINLVLRSSSFNFKTSFYNFLKWYDIIFQERI